MINYQYELGPLLSKVLSIIKESAEPVSRDELAKIMNVSKRIASDYLEALYRRGYIIDSRGDWKNENKEKVFVAEESLWIISVEGLNYLDLHRYWWTRFWTRSVLCPLIVAFVVSAVTALNVDTIRAVVKPITSIFVKAELPPSRQTPSPPPQDTEQ